MSSGSEFQGKEDDEVSIPRSSLNKLIKDIAPDARVSTEARDLLLACAHEFIHQLATRANESCALASKKTINPEHILDALDRLGLADYCARAREASEEAKVEAKARRMHSASYRFKHQDPEQYEELHRLQERMFQQSPRGGKRVGTLPLTMSAARAQLEEEEQLDRAELHMAAQAAAQAEQQQHFLAAQQAISASNPIGGSMSVPLATSNTPIDDNDEYDT